MHFISRLLFLTIVVGAVVGVVFFASQDIPVIQKEVVKIIDVKKTSE